MKKFTTLHSSEPTFTVSELNRQIQQLLEASLPWILVEGELSNLARPSSGHWYFSLKDDRAQIRCAMFKGKIWRSNSSLKTVIWFGSAQE